MTGEPMHTTSKERNGATINYPLHFVFSYVQPVTQHYKSRTVRSAIKVATIN